MWCKVIVLLTLCCFVLADDKEKTEENLSENTSRDARQYEHEKWRGVDYQPRVTSGWIPREESLSKEQLPKRRRIRKRKRRPQITDNTSEEYLIRPQRRRIRPQRLDQFDEHWDEMSDETERRPYNRRRILPIYREEVVKSMSTETANASHQADINPVSATLTFSDDERVKSDAEITVEGIQPEKIRDPFTALKEAELKQKAALDEEKLEREKTTIAPDLKILLKQNTGELSLSELLQQKNLSLSELLQGNQKAISALSEKVESSSEPGSSTEYHSATTKYKRLPPSAGLHKNIDKHSENNFTESLTSKETLEAQRRRLGLLHRNNENRLYSDVTKYDVVTEPMTEKRIFVPSHPKYYTSLDYVPDFLQASEETETKEDSVEKVSEPVTENVIVPSTHKTTTTDIQSLIESTTSKISLKPKIKLNLPITSAKLNKVTLKNAITNRYPLTKATTLPPNAFKIDLNELFGFKKDNTNEKKSEENIKVEENEGKKIQENVEKKIQENAEKKIQGNVKKEIQENNDKKIQELSPLLEKEVANNEMPLRTLPQNSPKILPQIPSRTWPHIFMKPLPHYPIKTSTQNPRKTPPENPIKTLPQKEAMTQEGPLKMTIDLEPTRNDIVSKRGDFYNPKKITIEKIETTTSSVAEKVKQETAKEEIMEILKDPISRERLARILEMRNMTVQELVEQRERGSSQLHLADIFHNKTKEPEPDDEPFVGHLSPEYFKPNRNTMRQHKSRLIFSSTDMDSDPNPIPIAFDAKKIFNQGTKKPDEVEAESPRSVYTVTSFPTYKIELEKAKNQPFLPIWKELYPTIFSGIPQSSDQMPIESTKPSLMQSDYYDLQRIEEVDNKLAQVSSEKFNVDLSHDFFRGQDEEEELIALPTGVKSAIIASLAIIGLSLLVFITILVVFRCSQKHKQRLCYRSSFSGSKIKSPILETVQQKRSLRTFMTETLGRKKNYYSKAHLQSMSDSIWETDKKPF